MRNLAKLLRWGYARTGEENSLTNYLSVPKGDDIRIVYNGTLRRLNAYLWDTHFALPTMVSTLRALEEGTYMADRDKGKCF